MADDERGRRVLSDLNLAFTRDPEIDEFGFIPCPEALQNRSPVILEQHKLGIESWSVPLVYQYAYTQLIQSRQKLVRPAQKELICSSRAVLLINPECYTAWNIRKELVGTGYLNIAADLQFSSLVLTRQPKSPETYAHRKWLLLELLKRKEKENTAKTCNVENGPHNGDGESQEIGVHINSFKLDEEMIQNEFAVCTHSAERYSNNYSAWSHRIWVIQHLTNCPQQLLLAELSRTTSLVSMHVSDHSGFHYRQFLIQEYNKQQVKDAYPAISTSKMRALLDTELTFTAELIEAYPGHEALWYNRRFLFHLLCHLPVEDCKMNRGWIDAGMNDLTTNGWQHKDAKTTNAHTPEIDTSTEYVETKLQANMQGKKFRADNSHKNSHLQKFLKFEFEFVDRCLETTHAVDYPAQLRCAESYKRWLNFMLKL
ncbi:protein prenyltransferase alpha subunit repeat-containing protein 1-like [Glandiceps talaboti]